MEDSRSAVALNLSNQSNMYRAKNTDLFQMNTVIMLGLSALDFIGSDDGEYIPVSFTIEKSGDVTISGIDIETIDEDDVYIHYDKKFTVSEKTESDNIQG